MYNNFSEMSASYDTLRISVLSRNSAVVSGEGPWAATDVSGNKYGGHLASMFVFVRRNGEWKLLHGHTSHTFN